MQGRRSLGGDLAPANDNINQIRTLEEHIRRLAEVNYLIPTKTEEETNQTMAVGGERHMVMKEYARPIIGTAISYIQLSEVARNYELKNVHFTMLIFIRDFYGTVQTFPLQGLTED